MIYMICKDNENNKLYDIDDNIVNDNDMSDKNNDEINIRTED